MGADSSEGLSLSIDLVIGHLEDRKNKTADLSKVAFSGGVTEKHLRELEAAAASVTNKQREAIRTLKEKLQDHLGNPPDHTPPDTGIETGELSPGRADAAINKLIEVQEQRTKLRK